MRWKERNRWEETEREGRRVRGNKRLQERGKERLSKEREIQLMASSYSKLGDNMKVSPQSIYHKKTTVCVCLCL